MGDEASQRDKKLMSLSEVVVGSTADVVTAYGDGSVPKRLNVPRPQIFRFKLKLWTDNRL